MENEKLELGTEELETKVEVQETTPSEKVESKLDIKDTKEMLLLMFALVKTYKVAKEDDGNVDMADIKYLMNVFPKLTDALEGVETIPAEVKDLDKEEIKELLIFSAAHLGEMAGGDEALVRKIEKGLAAAIAVVELIKEFKD